MWEWKSTSLPVAEMLGTDKKRDQMHHTRLPPPDENITTTCSYSTLAIRLVGGGIVVVRGEDTGGRGVEVHNSSDGGPAVFLSPLANHAHTHTHNPPTRTLRHGSYAKRSVKPTRHQSYHAKPGS